MLRALASILFCSCCALGADLAARLDPILASVPEGGEAGVVVMDVLDGSVLYQHAADTPLILASTTKVFVAGAALFQLTPTYRFRTRLVAMGSLDNGSLPGLGVIGGGDPTIDDHFAPDNDPNRILAAWAEELKQRGVRRIAGDVVIDGRMFSGPIRPTTYPRSGNNPQKWHSAPASAFAFNDNCIEARTTPAAAGEPARITTRPASPRIAIVNRTRSVPATQSTTVIVNRDADSNQLTLSGNCAKALGWLEAVAIHADPDLLAGDALKAALVAQGITVSGTVRRGEVNAEAPLLVERQQELVPALEVYLRRSQNFYGEQMLRVIGHAVAGEGSVSAGTTAVMGVLRKHLGLYTPQVNLLDGSGLSYGNTASAMAMARYLAAMAHSPVGLVFVSSFKDREVGVVQGKVKTGSLAVATTLVGYLQAPTGKRWCFAILCNQGESPSIAWAAKVRDRLVEAMAAAMR